MNELKRQLKEQLADIEHQRWAHWQRYCHSKMQTQSSPHGVVLPFDLYEHWERQINTPYAELSDIERQSDREQVDRYWPLIESLIEQVVDDFMQALDGHTLPQDVAHKLAALNGRWRQPESSDPVSSQG